MRRFVALLLVLAAVFVALVFLGELGVGPVVITHEGEQKVILLFGEPRGEPTQPGIALRLPLLEDMRTYERRQLYLNLDPAQIQTRDEERLEVDNYVVWRIADPIEFLRRFRGGGGMQKAEERIDRVVRADVREVIGRHTFTEVVTDARAAIMYEITAESRAELVRYGIHVADVRINRTELPRGTEENVWARMRAERERLARKHRAEGDEEARGIRAEADRESRVIVAEAHQRSEILRGEGDARAAHIYAEAYNTDPDFYAFVRNLEAYRRTIGKGTTLVLPPSHEFFRLFESSGSDGARPADGGGR